MTTIPEKQNPFLPKRVPSLPKAEPPTTVVSETPKPSWRFTVIASLSVLLLVSVLGILWMTFAKSNSADKAYALINSLTASLEEMDLLAKQIFGDDHRWHDVNSEPPPRCVRDWLEARGDVRLLEKYNELAAERTELRLQLSSYRQDVEHATTSESKTLELHQLLEIEQANRRAERQLQVLQSLEEIVPKS